MIINATFASTATSGEELAVATAINYLDTNFDVGQNVTFNLTFGTASLGSSGGVAESSSYIQTYSYAQLEQALYAKDTAAGATPVQLAAAASLPTTDPTNGYGIFQASVAYARMLGLSTESTPTDATIDLNSDLSFTYTSAGGSTGGIIAPGTFDAVGTLEHEITEALGRVADGGKGQGAHYTMLDMFRYTAAGGGSTVQPPGTAVGQRDEPFAYAATDPGYFSDQSYFSYDGKTVELPYDSPSEVANGDDVADWTSSVPNDSFGSGAPGQEGLISQADIDELQALGYTYTPVCFASGTRICTARGNVAVEDLAVGDLVVTADGTRRPLRWLGHRTLTGVDRSMPSHVWPVRVRRGAFGTGPAGDALPRRDLDLSPGHPVLVGADEDGAGGHLVPIMCLINGTTIERHRVEHVTYWHVELDAHDILLAEGLPAESYLDWGDRGFFSEGSDHALANPDFVVPGLAGRCRPVAIDGHVVEAERRRLDALFATQLAAACEWPGDASALTSLAV